MFESKLNRGRANGYAPLDSGSKVPLSYLPPIQSTIDTGSFVTTSSLQSLIDVTGSFATTSSLNTISESIDGRVSDLEMWSSSLTDTFATDLEVQIVSSSVAATIGIISQATGLLSTSSFNEYTASISTASLVDRLNIIESETSSFATTGSNVFNGNQTINGSLTITTPSTGVPNSVSNWNGGGGWNQGFYSNLTTTGGTGTGLTVDVTTEGSGYIDINSITINTPGSGYTNGDIITIDNENNLPGTFTIGVEEGSGWTFDTSGSLTTPGDINVSGSIYADNLDGLISSSAQITAFGFISSSQTIDTASFATTGSNTFVGSQKILTPDPATNFTAIDFRNPDFGIYGKSNSINARGNTLEFTATDYNINGDVLTHEVLTLRPEGRVGIRTTDPSNDFEVNGGVTAISFTGSISATNGVISGSSQLTSSFDERYLQSGSSLSSDSITFDRTAGINVTEGQMAWNNSDGTLDIGLNYGDVVLQVGQEQHFVVRNATGDVIENGTAVYASGLSAGSKRIEASPFTADGSVREVRFLGLATHDISNGVNGIVSHFGYVRGLDTRGTSVTAISVGDETWAEGDILYAHPTVAGKLTNIPPKHKIYVAMVTTRHQTTGVLFVRPSSYGHIDDVHDVRITTGSLVTGSMLEWNGDYFVNNDTFSSSVDTRLDTLENSTGSYLTSLSGAISSSSQLTASYDTRYTLSGSVVSGTTPAGTISGSSQLTSSFDARYLTIGGDNVISGSSQITGNLAVTSVSASVFVGGYLVPEAKFTVLSSKPMTFWPNTTYELVRMTTSGGVLIGRNGETSDYGLRLDVSGSVRFTGNTTITGSLIVTNGFTGSIASTNGVISGSSQLTSSFDSRYTLSGSVVSGTPPAGTISGSSQLTSSYDLRYETKGSNIVSGSSQLTASYDTRYALSSSVSSISSSFNSRFNGLVTTGSNTFSGSQVFSGSMTVTSGQVIASTITNNSSSLYLTSGSNLYVQNNGIVEITGSIVLNGTTYTSLTGSGTIPAGTVSGSSQLTSSYDTRYAPSASYLTSLNGALSSSTQVTNGSGIVSGSSQLTSSYDTRYTLSGSVVSGTTPAGTISGSSQLTSSFDGRYVQTGSFNTLTASFNSFTASAQSVTTGSNSFNGTQTITGSLIITTGSFFASQITANTASLYLTSGSNMYVQNNGVVEITGSLKVSGSTSLTGSLTIQSGSITMPNRPAFRVVGNGGAISSPTILSGSQLSVDYNQGNHWNNTTGYFTAPIAGLYQVNVVGRTNSNSLNAISQIIVYKNSGGTDTTQIMIEWGPNTSANHIGGSTISRLEVGDTLRAQVGAGTISFDGNDNFSVAYIG